MLRSTPCLSQVVRGYDLLFRPANLILLAGFFLKGKFVLALARLFLTVALSVLATLATADDIAFKKTQSVSVRGAHLPLVLYLRLTDQSQNRLGVDAFVDLRSFQRNVPGLLSGVLEETCRLKIAVAMKDAVARGDTITARGQVQAKLFACKTDDPKTHYRGVLLLGQNVNFTATAKATAQGHCIRFHLVDVTLDPLGFLGEVADLFGLTEKATSLILEKGGAALNSHPVCPELPPSIASLDPEFYAGGVREIEDGGLGVALQGSVDTSAATLLDLIRGLDQKGLLGSVEQ